MHRINQFNSYSILHNHSCPFGVVFWSLMALLALSLCSFGDVPRQCWCKQKPWGAAQVCTVLTNWNELVEWVLIHPQTQRLTRHSQQEEQVVPLYANVCMHKYKDKTHIYTHSSNKAAGIQSPVWTLSWYCHVSAHIKLTPARVCDTLTAAHLTKKTVFSLWFSLKVSKILSVQYSQLSFWSVCSTLYFVFWCHNLCFYFINIQETETTDYNKCSFTVSRDQEQV